jgi:hypothetical protein
MIVPVNKSTSILKTMTRIYVLNDNGDSDKEAANG